MTPTDAWLPAAPDVRSTPATRDPELYKRVILQFMVERNPRYTPRDGNTFCNIFTWDVTLAMYCEIPHWVDDFNTGIPVKVGKGVELNANNQCTWLAKHGPRYGWSEADLPTALANAKRGAPTLVTFLHVGGIGHVAMLLPTEPAPRIAQAGARNFYDEPLTHGFGKYPVIYYVHA